MIALTFIFLLVQPDSIQSIIVESSQQLFQKATSISAAPDGKVFVIDQSSNSLYVISQQNSILKTLGGLGWGNDAFDFPTDISSSFLLDILVVDANNRRVQRYDKNFNYIQTYDENILPQSSGRFQPIATATSNQGDLYILDNDGRRVITVNSRGQFEREFGTFADSKGRLIDPRDITVTAENEVIVLDGKTVIIFDRFGNYVRSIKLSSKESWKTINVSGRELIISSSSRIELINLDMNTSITIKHQSLIGSKVEEPFSDALIQGSILIILTQTTLYRCSFPQ
ncbi:MAG: NHL repeat-containing protein [Bacteroidota bacterium]